MANVRVSDLTAECDRDLGEPEHKNLRLAVDRCRDLLRRDMKPVMRVFHEFFPLISPHAVSLAALNLNFVRA